MRDYELIERAYPFRLRGNDNQQNNTGVLHLMPLEPHGTGRRLGGYALGYVSLHNRSGGSIAVGIGVRIPNEYWIAGQWVDAAGTPYTDDTTDAQDAGGADFALETTTVNDGYVVASSVPFNAISIDVGTASVGTPVRAARYTTVAGDGWTAFANLYIQDGASANYATGENLVVWDVPTDWGAVQASGLSGIRGGYYAMNVRATTAPTTAGVADNLSIYRLYFLTEALADNGLWELAFGGVECPLEPVGDALVAFFSTANNQNRASVLMKHRG